MELIDKDAVVAEIERRISILAGGTGHPEVVKRVDGIIKGYKSILFFLDSLEVKEVELWKEIDKEWNKCEPIDDGMGLEIASIEHEQFDNIAKRFYKLGLNANNNSVIEKACEWLKNNVVYTHPRTGETKCVVNLNAFIDAMKG